VSETLRNGIKTPRLTESQDGNQLLAARGLRKPRSIRRKYIGQATGIASDFRKKTMKRR
jgi:hypothetical protein